MHFITCRITDKISTLLFISRWAIQMQKQTVIFCATMKYVEYLVSIFKAGNLDCTFLYSQLDPAARRQNIERFFLIILILLIKNYIIVKVYF